MARGLVVLLAGAGLVMSSMAATAGSTSARPAAAGSTAAGPTEATPEQLASAETDRIGHRDFDARQRMSATYPNELWRLYGSDAAGRGQWQDASRFFRRAARYADKYSQHRLSLMYWHGLGVPHDRALAYAWADLAAERSYPQFVLLREKMWQELDEAERQRALRQGVAIFDEYADETAKPRMERAVARARSRITGSPAGLTTGNLRVFASRGGSSLFDPGDSLDLRPMYADWRMDTRRYWAVEDAVWQSGGNVEVGTLETIMSSQRP
ncbi:hypothetical protein [Lysobacter sp. CA196]|uniref:hypothetical protein n=1 Tax=Lysobacter sp. CA196 TaxID=3455606 RepID=UPI003F8D0595